MTLAPEKIRNIAIIAHIDHGKTTLLDCLLRQANTFAAHEKIPERVMDSYDQERERGITIFSKHTSIQYEGYTINVIDTPGHADFAGEVERVLGMVGSVLLVVDAAEGPMPQTRFVLSKALKMGLRPIIVLNKIDKPGANPDRTLDLTFDLCVELGATDEQLDFAHITASAIKGVAGESDNMRPLFDLIVDKVPAPTGDPDGPFLMQVATVGYDDFVGRKACGRILRGTIKKHDQVIFKGKPYKITQVQGYQGLAQIELPEASAGNIVSLAGIPEVMIGDTLSCPDQVEELPGITIEEPTVALKMTLNSSPFVGKEGKHVTINKIRERLKHEEKANITYRFDFSAQDSVTIAGRGELHLAILVEAMRREGYEMSLLKPQVITKTIDGVLHEPIQQAHIEVPEEHSGAVIEELSKRKGELQAMETDEHGITRMEFLIPTRGLMGYRNTFLTVTRGEGIMTAIFDHYAPHKGEIPSRSQGSLVATDPGKATAYSIFNLQPRGSLFVKPTDPVYKGMIVGEHNRNNDLGVNIVKEKKLTNVRASGSDQTVVLTPPRVFTLETAIDWIKDDEMIEVTPQSIRLRKVP